MTIVTSLIDYFNKVNLFIQHIINKSSQIFLVQELYYYIISILNSITAYIEALFNDFHLDLVYSIQSYNLSYFKQILNFVDSTLKKGYVILMDFESLNLDPHEIIKDDLLQSPYLRYYIQEQFFVSSTPKLQIKLPFNLIVNETVCDLNLMNRVVANNSRLTNSFLQNGKDILRKKDEYFNDFLKMYPIIHHTLACLPPEKRLVYIYSIMALSNLILKLSINMAKISIVTVTHLPVPKYSNIFIVSILFQKFLEYSLLKTKETIPSEKKDKEHIVKQFPKISIVKLSKIRNVYDFKYLQKSQQLFDQNTKNIQFIELYEEDLTKEEHQSTYPRYESTNLKNMLGLTQPFGFELYLFISEIIVHKMVDFKPDMIIYMQDYDSDCVVIEPRVRGLILNQFSARVQNKIYVLKQVGITQQMKEITMIKHNRTPVPEMIDNEQINGLLLKIICSKTQNIVLSTEQIELYKSIKEQINRYIQESNYLQNCINKQLIDLKQQDYKFQKNSFLVQGKKKEETALTLIVKDIKKILLDKFVHVSSAMIQKSNFQGVLQDYRNHKFEPVFLNKLIKWLHDELHKLKQKEKAFSQTHEFMRKKIQKITGMLNLSTFISKQQLPQTSSIKGFPIYNLKTNLIENPNERKGNQFHPIHISAQDSFYVVYQIQFLIIFIFRPDKYNIYVRHLNQDSFTCERQESYESVPFLLCKNSILVNNDKYFYKAFGQFQKQQDNKESLIHRLNIQKPRQINSQPWQTMSKQCMVFTKINNVNKGIKIPLEFKRHGYGYHYIAYQTGKPIDIIILGGGYNFKVENEQKVNRYLYIIKNNGSQIVKIGKTNTDIVNQAQNLKGKNIVYSFVYGLPLQYQKGKQVAIINTNGYEEGLNHFKRLFMTKIQINSFNNPNSIGIIAQNKLEYNKNDIQTAIAHKNSIISLLIKNYNKVNRQQNRVVFYDGKENIIVFKLQKHKEHGYDTFNLNTATFDQEKHIQAQFSNKTLVLNSKSTCFQ